MNRTYIMKTLIEMKNDIEANVRCAELDENYELVYTAVPTVIVRDDNLYVSGEDGKNIVDYYGEFRGGDPYIEEPLEKWAEDNNGYWEWENPGCVCFAAN